jgi:hypothetical protein
VKDISTTEIKAAIPRLHNGNFWYWVRYKAKIEPCGKRPNKDGRHLEDLYPHDAIEKIKIVMGE